MYNTISYCYVREIRSTYFIVLRNNGVCIPTRWLNTVNILEIVNTWHCSFLFRIQTYLLTYLMQQSFARNYLRIYWYDIMSLKFRKSSFRKYNKNCTFDIISKLFKKLSLSNLPYSKKLWKIESNFKIKFPEKSMNNF